MTEANYSFTTKINGDLFTVRGTSHKEFQTNLAEACDGLTVTTELIGVLQAAGNAIPAVNVQAPRAPQQPQFPQQAPALAQPQFPSNAQPAQPQQVGHVCQCGLPMKLRNGQYGSFYSCSKQMNDPSRCKQTINV